MAPVTLASVLAYTSGHVAELAEAARASFPVVVAAFVLPLGALAVAPTTHRRSVGLVAGLIWLSTAIGCIVVSLML